MLGNKARRTWHIALGPTDIPHTRRPRARPTPAGRKGSDRLGRQQNEYLALHVQERRVNDHFRPLAPNPSTSPRAVPRNLGRSRAILGRSRGRAAPSRAISDRAAAHLLKKGRARLEPRGSRARSRCAVRRLTLCATCEALARAGEAAPRAPARSSRHSFLPFTPSTREREGL